MRGDNAERWIDSAGLLHEESLSDGREAKRIAVATRRIEKTRLYY